MPHAAHTDIPTNPSDHACIDLVNSCFADYLGGGDDTDRITSAEWQGWFLARHDLQPESSARAPVAKLIALRRDLRRVLDKWSREMTLTPRDVRALDDPIRAAPLRLRVTRTDAEFHVRQEPLRRDWTWVMAAVTASAVELLRTGDPQRLKTCSNPNCSWMYYDTSINRSRQYCSTSPCGSLIRVRRFRQR